MEFKQQAYFKWHNSNSYATNDCNISNRQILPAIHEGWLEFVAMQINEQCFPVCTIEFQERKIPDDKENITLKTSMLGWGGGNWASQKSQEIQRVREGWNGQGNQDHPPSMVGNEWGKIPTTHFSFTVLPLVSTIEFQCYVDDAYLYIILYSIMGMATSSHFE